MKIRKPRILFDEGQWLCFVETFPDLPYYVGSGNTPEEAYEDWRSETPLGTRLREMGFAEVPK